MQGRAMVFIDGSNFFGACRDFKPGMKIDFEKLSVTLVQQCGASDYQGTYYYGSHPPMRREATEEEKKRLANQFRFFEALEYLKGYSVRKSSRKIRNTTCAKCGTTIDYTVEKGVDTSIVTEMISLAWEDAFDIAVLVSEDADLVPAVQFLNRIGKKVYHAYFTKLGRGHQLRKACFGQIPLDGLISEVQVRK